jgi:hypothetical protein
MNFVISDIYKLKTNAMETKIKKEVNSSIKGILKLYEELPLMMMLNDIVAIGTWPTPEDPFSVKINTVPLPDRPKKLKKILSELIAISKDSPIKKLFK